MCFENFLNLHSKSLIRRQKGESQNGGKMKTKQAKFSKNTNIFDPLIGTRSFAYQSLTDVWKILRALFSCYFRFVICSFALLPTL